MLIQITRNFVAEGFDSIPVGEVREVQDAFAQHLVEIGVAKPYETKVDPPPAEIKKNVPSPSSRRGQVSKKKTVKKRTKKQK